MFITPEQSRFLTDDELFKFENQVLEKRSMYDYLMITGDTNAHISTLPDCSVNDAFMSNIFDLNDGSTW